MKTFKYIGLPLLAAGTLMMSSCKDEFLEPKPLSYFEPGVTFNTESGIKAALIACDNELRNQMINLGGTGKYTMPIQEIRLSDLAVGGNTDYGHITCFGEVYTKTTPTSAYDRMSYCFTDVLGTGVKSANTILDYVDNVSGLSETVKNEYKGRAYFHRAWRYYNLIFQFKNVPLITHVISTPKLDYKSTTREAIIAKMIEDLEFAVKNVPDQAQMDNYGMVNKGACQMLLAKYYLAAGEWQKAKNVCDDLIGSPNYSLMKTNFGTFDEGGEPATWKITENVIWDLHRPENKMIATNKEYIFGVANQGSGSSFVKNVFMRGATPFWCNGTNTTPVGGLTATSNYARNNPNYDKTMDFVRAIGRGISDMRPTYFAEHDVWCIDGKMDKGDLRHSVETGNWFPRDALKYNNPEIKKSANPEVQKYYGKSYAEAGFPNYADTIKSRFGFPHYKTYLRDVVQEGLPGSTDFQGATLGSNSNWYVYRLAEAYLLRAEAKLYMGDKTAVDDVNAIRERAHCEYMYTTVNIGDIMDERARELTYEEFRRVELSRVSLCLAKSGVADEWGNTYDINTYDKQEGTDPKGGSYWYQRVTHYNNYYNKGDGGIFRLTKGTVTYNIGKQNLYFPIPNDAIQANSGAPLFQNYGYTGYDESIPMWTTAADAEADEVK